MFEFLRKEIVVLRKKNTKIKKELAEAESDKREIFQHVSAVEHSAALSNIRVQQMTKTNMALLEENTRRRKEVTKLKNELKTQQQAHEAQLQEMRAEFEVALSHRENEVNNLQTNIRSSTVLHKKELQALMEEQEKKREQQYSEISHLREEIKHAQDSHEDYMSKLMGVLETTQGSRRNLFPGDRLGSDLRSKDEEIANLKDEIERLRQAPEEDMTAKKEASKSMKYIVKKNREQRKSHVQYLSGLANEIESNALSGNTSEVQQLVASLKQAVLAGEKTNSKMDRETVNMIDHGVVYSKDGAAEAALLADNQKLKRKLKKGCKQCGYKRGSVLL